MVQSHIKSLLYAYDCVIIPEFGGLITHYSPAKIHPVKHTFSPPGKRVAFNEQLKVNDGLLISTLAHKQQWPLPQAQQTVAAFVQELKEELLAKHKFELKDVGVFRYNAERKLVFENLESENFLEHSFGLPELVSKPIPGKETLVLRGNYQDQTAGQGKKASRLRKLYRTGASLLIGGLSITAIYLFSLQTDVALSSLNPFTLISTANNNDQVEHQPAQSSDLDAFDQAQLTEQYKSTMPQFATVEEELAYEDSVLAQFPKNSRSLETEETTVAVATLSEKTPVPEATVETAAVIESSKPVAAKVVKTPEVKKEVVASAATINKKTGRFYIIMGVFSLNGYASNNQKKLKKKGYDAKVIEPAYDTKRQRVSVADYATEAEAYAALPALRSKISNELWVFNY